MSAHLTATPSSLVFDEVKKATFALHNTGDVDVHVTSMTLAGANHAAFGVKPPLNFTIHKGAQHAVEVDLLTSTHAPAHATLTVHGNAPNVVVSLNKTANYVPHGPGPNPGSESPSTGPNTDDPSGTGWGVVGSPVGSAPGFSTSPDGTGTGGGCFVAGIRVLMADGTARRIEEIGIGDAILAIAERDHAEQVAPAPREARIEHVFRHDDGAYALLDVDGIRATAVHRWGVREGGDEAGFLRTDQLGSGTVLRVYDGRSAAWRAAAEPRAAGSAETVYNFTTSARTYLVGASAEGPWYVVHNDKKANPDDTNP